MDQQSMTSILQKASLVVLGVGLLIHLVSFSTTHWAASNHMSVRSEHIGLWRRCSQAQTAGGGHVEICTDYINIITEDWQNAAQSFATIAIFTYGATIGVFAAFILVPDFRANVKVLCGCVAMALTTAFFLGIALASFGAHYQEYFTKIDPAFVWGVGTLSWSYYLCMTALFMVFASPFMILPEAIQSIRDEK